MNASVRLAGVDIGGTKIAVSLGTVSPAEATVHARRVFPTTRNPGEAIGKIIFHLQALLREVGDFTPQAIGVSCGSPMDPRRGLILGPPNLPGWEHVDILSPLRQAFSLPVGLENDANAGALAEWRWGAGRGARNMIFLTFGTGMGAGLILDGRLYAGTNDNAGEAGHIRLEHDGPVGYGKAGSFEGFCSGGGIAKWSRLKADEAIHSGHAPGFCPTIQDLPAVTTEKVALAARRGDPLAMEIFHYVGRQLGRGLAVLVDLLNPERIVLGSIFGRQRELLEQPMWEALKEEALPMPLAVVQIVPAGLGEAIGDLEALSVALEIIEPYQASSAARRQVSPDC